MISKTIDKLQSVSPWHFIWISIVSSELITYVLSTIQGRVWWGAVSRETLIIGAIDAMVVPLIVATTVVYFVRRTAELRTFNEQLQEANAKLREIDRMKSDFISVVSHEFRTPLTSVKACAELIIMKPGMPEKQRARFMNAINAETDRLTRLLTDLLDLARIEAGSMQWRVSDVSVEEVIADCASGMAPLFDNKGLRLTTAVNSPLPRLSGDRDRLIQVVMNILSNAVKYTRPGGAVRIEARQESAPLPQIVVEISDTGVGIPPAEIELIFEKFHRAGDQLSSTVEGTGLGLAIARQIVEHHGGRIWAKSSEGKGSVFTFTLPLPGLKPAPPA